MKLKHLESHLSRVRPFDKPDVSLEQYPTSAHLAARLAFGAHQRGDIEDCRVCDLGCGTAMLGIAAELMGSALTVGFDVSDDALRVARENIDSAEVDMLLVKCDVSADDFTPSRVAEYVNTAMQEAGWLEEEEEEEEEEGEGEGEEEEEGGREGIDEEEQEQEEGEGEAGGGGILQVAAMTAAASAQEKEKEREKERDSNDEESVKESSKEGASGDEAEPPFLFDTVVMNPPFGTKPGNKGIDVLFLERGRRLLRPGGTLYSLHKSSTRAFLLKKAKKEWGMVEAEVVAELKFDIPQMYKFHKKKSVDVKVDLLRFVTAEDKGNGQEGKGKGEEEAALAKELSKASVK